MKIKDLYLKNNPELVTILSDAPAMNAVTLLNQHNIGALPVRDPSGELVGIISERDIIRSLSESNLGLDNMTVENLMTPDVATCGPDDDVTRVLEIMDERQIRHIPVLVAGRLSNIISSRDVITAALGESKSRLTDMVLAYEMVR